MSSIRHTPEIARILALPRRTFTPAELDALADELTEILRTPTGKMRLRPVQAWALYDAGTAGGLLGSIGVGEGKTLISLLVAFVLQARRPMLLLPAGLIENAHRARERMARHFIVPKNIRLFSYDMLGRDEYKDELTTYQPDLLVCDEVHRLKNMGAAVTKRVDRWMTAHPETHFVGMSGTIMRDSLEDFAHIIRWALKDNAPIPARDEEVALWAKALANPRDAVDELEQPDPGALVELCPDIELRQQDPLTAARKGFRARMVETPGVVTTAGEGERVDCSIYLTIEIAKVNEVTDQHFAKLREWEMPNGDLLENGNEVWRHARELALGFHYEWRVPAPDDWLDARKAWSAFVREVLSRSRTLDSPEEVVNAVDAGHLPKGEGLLATWRAVKDTFKPDTIAVWHDDSVLKRCAQWAKQPGIIWVEHTLFAERLSRETGIPYFGESGFSADGVYIEDADGDKPLIASIRANRDGKNLQHKWFRNLVVSPPDGWDAWQQMIGRTHRPGQKADAVIVDVLWGCKEHVTAWDRAIAGTLAARDTVGTDQETYRLLLALPDAVIPQAPTSRKRWTK
jgi:hypothetical protein